MYLLNSSKTSPRQYSGEQRSLNRVGQTYLLKVEYVLQSLPAETTCLIVPTRVQPTAGLPGYTMLLC